MKPRFRIFFKNDVYKFTGYDLIHSHFLMSVIDGVLIGDVCYHFWYDMNGKLVEVQENYRPALAIRYFKHPPSYLNLISHDK